MTGATPPGAARASATSSRARRPNASTRAETIELELPASPSFNAVGRLVIGGLASRLGLAVADIEDLQLAVEAVLWRRARDGTVNVTLRHSERDLQARLGPFACAADRERVERMLLRLVDDAVLQDSSDGEWIVMRQARERAIARGSS